MNSEDRAITARIDRLAQELLDRDWLELGVSQEELDQSRLSTQQMNAALANGYSMDDVLRMWDCLPSDETLKQEDALQHICQPDACADRRVEEPRIKEL